VCRIPGGLLNDQVYHISVQLVENMAFILARIDDAIAIDVVDDDAADRRGGWYGGWVGAVRPPLTWSTALASSNLEGHKMG
jgi:lipopolysaccharide transport system ATP-binding protein